MVVFVSRRPWIRRTCVFLGDVATAEHVAFDVAAAYVDGLEAGEGRVRGNAVLATAIHILFHRAATNGGHSRRTRPALRAAAIH